jgi:hypothetical protein
LVSDFNGAEALALSGWPSDVSTHGTDLGKLIKGGLLARRNHDGMKMRQKSRSVGDHVEKVVKDIRRVTCKQYSA